MSKTSRFDLLRQFQYVPFEQIGRFLVVEVNLVYTVDMPYSWRRSWPAACVPARRSGSWVEMRMHGAEMLACELAIAAANR